MKRKGTQIANLIVNVDDIVITRNDIDEVKRLKKKHLHSEFEIKDLGKLRYFLGIEFAKSKKGFFFFFEW